MGHVRPPLLLEVIYGADFLEHDLHVIPQRFAREPIVLEAVVAKLDHGAAVQPDHAGRARLAYGRLSVQRLLVEEHLLTERHADVRPMLECLNLAVFKNVAQRQLAIEYNEDICYVRVLIIDLLAPSSLHQLALAEDHLERIEAHLLEPRMVQPHLLQKQVLLGCLAHVHRYSILVNDIFHDLVVALVEHLMAGHAAQILMASLVDEVAAFLVACFAHCLRERTIDIWHLRMTLLLVLVLDVPVAKIPFLLPERGHQCIRVLVANLLRHM